MSWEEVKTKIDSRLLGDLNEANGFPPPDEAEFWEGVLHLEEIVPFLCDQAKKLTEQDQDARDLWFEAFNLMMSGGREDSSQDSPDLMFAMTEVGGLFGGPLKSALLERLGVPRDELREDTLALLNSHRRELDDFAAGEKALLWWAVLPEYLSSDRIEAIRSLLELNINPPEIR